MSRRHGFQLVIVVQHGRDPLHLRIWCLDLVQPTEQDKDEDR